MSVKELVATAISHAETSRELTTEIDALQKRLAEITEKRDSEARASEMTCREIRQTLGYPDYFAMDGKHYSIAPLLHTSRHGARDCIRECQVAVVDDESPCIQPAAGSHPPL